MPRDGAIIFGDLISKLDVLRVECPKCGRLDKGRRFSAIVKATKPAPRKPTN
jgi:hypothetical protein